MGASGTTLAPKMIAFGTHVMNTEASSCTTMLLALREQATSSSVPTHQYQHRPEQIIGTMPYAIADIPPLLHPQLRRHQHLELHHYHLILSLLATPLSQTAISVEEPTAVSAPVAAPRRAFAARRPCTATQATSGTSRMPRSILMGRAFGRLCRRLPHRARLIRRFPLHPTGVLARQDRKRVRCRRRGKRRQFTSGWARSTSSCLASPGGCA